MNDQLRRKRLIVIVTRTNDTGAKACWFKEFEKRGCNVRVVSPEECINTFRGCEGLTSYLIDDVNPETIHNVRMLVLMLRRVRPEPPCVFLVGKCDYDNVADIMDARTSLLHIDGNSMDQVYDFLAAGSEVHV